MAHYDRYNCRSTSKAEMRKILNALSMGHNRQDRAYKAVYLYLCKWSAHTPQRYDFRKLDRLMAKSRLCWPTLREEQYNLDKTGVLRAASPRYYDRARFLRHCLEHLPYEPDDDARRAALVLHSGRDDGVTEACCVQLARTGHDVAILFADIGPVVAAEMAAAASRVKQCGRKAVALPKVDLWKGDCGEEILTKALDALSADRGFDVIGNNTSSLPLLPPNYAPGLTKSA